MNALRCFCLTVACLFSTQLSADIYSSPSESDIPALVQSLADPNVQLGASRALTSLKGRSVESLQAALDSESSEVRIWAAYTLGQIGSSSAPAITRLTETLSTATDPYERAASVRSLGQIATPESAETSGLLRSLIKGLTDSDDEVRRCSAEALGRLGPAAQKAAEDLVDAFADEPVRQAAITAVLNIGKPAVPTLIAALNDDTIRLDAAQALRQLDPPTAVKVGVDRPSAQDLPALRLALLDESRQEDARVALTQMLGEIGKAGAPILVDAFASDSDDVSRSAAAAFRQIGPSAVPILQEAKKSESPGVRARSVDALGAIGPTARSAVPSLVEALSDSDRTVQHRAVVALDMLGEAAVEAIPPLIQVMQNPRVLEKTRALALKVLVRDPSKGQRDTVVAALEESAKDSNYGISSLAKASLKQLSE